MSTDTVDLLRYNRPDNVIYKVSADILTCLTSIIVDILYYSEPPSIKRRARTNIMYYLCVTFLF